MPKPKSLLKEAKPKKKTAQQVCNSYFTFYIITVARQKYTQGPEY